MPNQTVKNGLRAKKDRIAPNEFFSQKTIKFSCTYYWHLSFCKIFKKFLGLIQSYEVCHFWAQNGPFAPNKKFIWKIIKVTIIYLLAPFIVQNFTKILPADPDENFFFPFPQMKIFSRKPINKPCFFHSAYIHAKTQSQILIY